jgi:hypothetical protein
MKAWLFLAVPGVLGLAAFASSGNAWQRISVGPWNEVGKAEAPLDDEPVGSVIETTQPGTGRVVTAGDLVQVRLQEHVVWLWLGREPPIGESGRGTPGDAPFGNMGSPHVRNALIGRTEHEKFTLRLAIGSRRSVAVPARVFATDPLGNDRIVARDAKAVPSSVPDWPEVVFIASADSADLVLESEILEVCQAKLFQRTATLRQWGWVVGWGEQEWRFAREGLLSWSLLDAQCAGPRGNLKIQVGPIHSADQGGLFNWAASYLHLRPAVQFPEEWSVPAST